MAVVNLLSLDVSAIFQELRNTTGLFREWKESGDDIVAQCPFHGGGNERKPSFGLCVNKANPNYGLYNCFACGAHGSIISLINELNNKSYGDNYGIQVAQQLGDVELVDSRGKITLLSRVQVVAQTTVSPYELLHYRAHSSDYLTNRHVQKNIQDAFDCGFDTSSDSVTFPVRRVDGATQFVARRSTHQKWYNYPAGVQKPVYGVYEMHKLAPHCRSWIIVESIINALTLWGMQLPAVALLGTGSREQIEFLNRLDTRQYVLALDGDKAGAIGTAKLQRKLRAHTLVMPMPPGYDVNDLDPYTLSILHTLRR